MFELELLLLKVKQQCKDLSVYQASREGQQLVLNRIFEIRYC